MVEGIGTSERVTHIALGPDLGMVTDTAAVEVDTDPMEGCTKLEADLVDIHLKETQNGCEPSWDLDCTLQELSLVAESWARRCGCA